MMNFRSRLLSLWLFISLVAVPVAGIPAFATGQKAAQQPVRRVEVEPEKTKATILTADETVAEDPEVKIFVEKYGASIKAKLSEVIAHTPREIRRGSGSDLGRLVADAMLAVAHQKTKRKVDLAISNTYGMRGDLPAGDITIANVFTIMPFENQLVLLELTGQQLLEGFEYVATHFDESAGFPLANCIVRVKDEKLVSVEIGGLPLDPKKTYTLATSDYLYYGGDGYHFSQGKNFRHVGVTLRDAIISYMRQQKTVEIPTQARFINESAPTDTQRETPAGGQR
ncbi:MAG: 5'-nucleotidase C-terminal domain-containing protein [Acidobacteria bacterium]|nr:5'-nucleotidase C-terminal domain-containing protein [Acidobacteriota bacterium]